MIADTKRIDSTTTELFKYTMLGILVSCIFLIPYLGASLGILSFSDIYIPHVYEILATIFNLSCVFLFKKENMWAWPVGLLGIIFFILAFYQYQVYGQFLLNLLFFLPLQLYGWYNWIKEINLNKSGIHVEQISISRSSKTLIASVVLGIVLLLGLFVYCKTVGIFPLQEVYNFININSLLTIDTIDMLLVLWSIAAQILLNLKKVENWLLWTAVNVISLVYFYTLGMYIFIGIYLVFLYNAITAYFLWSKQV